MTLTLPDNFWKHLFGQDPIPYQFTEPAHRCSGVVMYFRVRGKGENDLEKLHTYRQNFGFPLYWATYFRRHTIYDYCMKIDKKKKKT